MQGEKQVAALWYTFCMQIRLWVKCSTGLSETLYVDKILSVIETNKYLVIKRDFEATHANILHSTSLSS